MQSQEINFFEGIERDVPAELVEALTAVELVDHHVHGTFTKAVSRAAFEETLNEASPSPIPDFMTMFDSQLGLAVRRWAAPQLGLPAFSSPEEYWQRRVQSSPIELDRLMLAGVNVRHWIVDTGFSSASISSPEALADASNATSSEIVRLESLAETVASLCTSPGEFIDAFRAALEETRTHAVGFKTIAAYRVGFDIDWLRPSDDIVTKAVGNWMGGSEPARTPLADPLIIVFLIHAAAELKMPIQFHVGYGDRDLDLHKSNPMLLLPLLRQVGLQDTPVMLLHCWPYHREAGYLAQAFTNVYFDVGLALNYVGAQSTQIVRESLEVAPFAKQLFSSDAFGLVELHCLGSVLWRRSMGLVLGSWVRQGDWSLDDAVRVIRLIGYENADRVYGLTR